MSRPEVILREEMQRRLDALAEMEQLAAEGRVDFELFEGARAHAQGFADALKLAVSIVCPNIGASTPHVRVTTPAGPWSSTAAETATAVSLAQQGLDVEAIATRCGLTMLEVAESLAQYVWETAKH